MRRTLLTGGVLTGIAAFLGLRTRGAAKDTAIFEVSHTDAEWKGLLTPAAYNVLRHEGTEAPGSSKLDHLFQPGVYDCAGCDLPLFESKAKFDSGTGWPSFFAPMQDAVGTTADYSLLMKRVEVHCRRCGGHLGHVFNDGPAPTGLRYCMNGAALAFKPV